MTNRKSVRGFTLIELLVVMIIIAVLIGLLMPAINAAVEAARKNTCMNHQSQLAKAVIMYESSNEHLPGYANAIAGGNTSWVEEILSFFRKDLWKKRPITTGTYVEILVCPSDPPADKTGSSPLSYVANCGLKDAVPGDAGVDFTLYPPDWKSNGVFFDLTIISPPNVMEKIDFGFIADQDGVSNTLMLTENIQAGQWYLASWGANINGEHLTGFVWHDVNPAISPPPNAAGNMKDTYMINALKANVDVGGEAKDVVGPPAFDAIDWARPSSNHPGGVVVTFCDGHSRFMSELSGNADYQLRALLMTPHGKYAKKGGLNTPVSVAYYTDTTLDEGKIK